jgi:hypothetical protein
LPRNAKVYLITTALNSDVLTFNELGDVPKETLRKELRVRKPLMIVALDVQNLTRLILVLFDLCPALFIIDSSPAGIQWDNEVFFDRFLNACGGHPNKPPTIKLVPDGRLTLMYLPWTKAGENEGPEELAKRRRMGEAMAMKLDDFKREGRD